MRCDFLSSTERFFIAVTLAAASGIGYATILDTRPVIHGCYQKNGGILYV